MQIPRSFPGLRRTLHAAIKAKAPKTFYPKNSKGELVLSRLSDTGWEGPDMANLFSQWEMLVDDAKSATKDGEKLETPEQWFRFFQDALHDILTDLFCDMLPGMENAERQKMYEAADACVAWLLERSKE